MAAWVFGRPSTEDSKESTLQTAKNSNYKVPAVPARENIWHNYAVSVRSVNLRQIYYPRQRV